MVDKAAAPTTAATGVPGVVVGQQPGRVPGSASACVLTNASGKVWPGNCRGSYCVRAAASPTVPVPVSAQMLARLQARQLDLSICRPLNLQF